MTDDAKRAAEGDQGVSPVFTGRQRRVVAAGVTVLAAGLIGLFAAAAVWLIARFFSAFSNVFVPLAVAWVAALVFHPYYDWLRARLRLGKVPAILVLYATVLAPLVLFLWFFGALLVEQLRELVQALPVWSAGLREALDRHWPGVQSLWSEHDLGLRLQQLLRDAGGQLLSGLQAAGDRAWSVGAAVVQFVTGALGWIVFPVYVAFFLMMPSLDVRQFDKHLFFLKDETRNNVLYLLNEFAGILVAFFRGQLVVAFAQGVLFAIGFVVVGLNYGLVLGLVLGFLNIIPYLGSMVGLAAALPIAYFQPGGGWVTVALVLAVFTAVQTIEGYVLTPRIMGRRTGLHPMAIIVAVFFWGTALNGIAGMILAVPLTAFFVVFWRLISDRYLKELV